MKMSTCRNPGDSCTGTLVLVVSRQCPIQGEGIQNWRAVIEGRPDRQHVVLANIRPHRHGDAVADGKAVEELVDEQVVGPAIPLGCIAKRGQAAGAQPPKGDSPPKLPARSVVVSRSLPVKLVSRIS